MKTKLTLNIDDKVVARAKKATAKRKISLSSLVEEYLDRYTRASLPKKEDKKEPSILRRIRKYTRPVDISDDEIEKRKEEYMKKKYGL
jgi:Family of unknown function (DUF6364)